jgi:REP element-mobilizing transposase RayT
MTENRDPSRTIWHITFGTYGTRLHGDQRPTVQRRTSQPGQPFVDQNAARWTFERNSMKSPTVTLSQPQRRFIEMQMSQICEKGGWHLKTCAAATEHVHVLCDAPTAVHGDQIRTWLKRWLTIALNQQWPKPPSGRWWAKAGSNKPIKNEQYVARAFDYIQRQCATPPTN